MDDFYEKLGNLLNEKIENDENPQRSNEKSDNSVPENKNGPVNEQVTIEKNQNNNYFEKNVSDSEQSNEADAIKVDEKSENASKKRVKIPKSHEKTTGEVIKMHKYAEFPIEIACALTTLDIAYPITLKNIKKRYLQLIKQYHPDLKQSTKDNTVTFSRQLDINTIINCYEILKRYFNK